VPVAARTWWAELERRLAGSGITLTATIEADRDVSSALFDSFVENGLDNARAKLGREPGIEISILFKCTAERFELSLCDTGSAVPDSIAHKLFRGPIERSGALGIGLFHAARQAQQAGYRLSLSDNRQGYVCFALTRDG
jgi:sensor histidine kinase regulating citrate/malate metabolism